MSSSTPNAAPSKAQKPKGKWAEKGDRKPDAKAEGNKAPKRKADGASGDEDKVARASRAERKKANNKTAADAVSSAAAVSEAKSKPDPRAPTSDANPVVKLNNWTSTAGSISVPVHLDSPEHLVCMRDNYVYHKVEGRGFNAHGPGAVQRRKAVFHVLGLAADRGARTLRDLWGSMRTIDYARTMSHIDYPVRITVDGQIQVPADINRRSDLPEAGEIANDALMLVNVYETTGSPLTPSLARDFLDEYAASVLYIVHHRFPDAAGVIDETGSYVRDVQGRVIYRPSPSDGIYGPHDPCDWLLGDGSASGVTWALSRSFGDAHVTVVMPLSTPANATIVPLPRVTLETIDLPDTSSYLSSFIHASFPAWTPRRVLEALGAKFVKTLVDVRLKAIACQTLRGVKFNDTTYRSVHNRIHRELCSEPWATILKNFPDMEESFVEGTVFAAQIHVANRENALVTSFNRRHGATVFSRTQALNAMGRAPGAGSWWTWALPASLGAVALYVGVKLRDDLSRIRGHTWSFGMSSTRNMLFSAIFEEGLRYAIYAACPPVALFVPTVFTLFEVLRFGRHGFYTFPLHAILSLVPTWMAFGIHILVNANNSRMMNLPAEVPEPPEVTAWTQFKDVYLEAPIVDVPALVPEESRIATTPIDPDQYRVRDRTDTRQTAVPVTLLLETSFLQSLYDVPPRTTYHYAIAPCNAPYFVPGISGDMISAMVVRRKLKRTPLETHHKVTSQQALKRALKAHSVQWSNVTRSMTTALRANDYILATATSKMVIKDIRDKWFERLPPHNKAMLTAVGERVGDADVSVTGVKINQKRNEKLYKRDDQGRLDPLCRAIDAVHPKAIYATGPAVFEGTRRIKETFSPEAFLAGDASRIRYTSLNGRGKHPVDMHLIFGPMDDLTLARVMTKARTSDAVVCIIAGDDGLMTFVGRHLTLCIEGDFSMYDASQFGSVIHFEHDILEFFGVSTDVIRLLEDVAEADDVVVVPGALTQCRISPSALSKKWITMLRRRTGGANTTIGGGICNAGFMGELASTLGSDWEEMTEPQIEEIARVVAAELGFALKCRAVLSSDCAFVGATFLKHVILRAECMDPRYQPTSEVFIACPLPSRILKLGVCLRDPTELYVGDRQQAAMRFLRDQAVGIRDAWLLTPLREFVDALAPEKDAQKEVLDKEDEYRVGYARHDELLFGQPKHMWRASGVALFFQSRYGLDRSAVDSLGAMYAQLTHPTFFEHPAFELMARRDYA